MTSLITYHASNDHCSFSVPIIGAKLCVIRRKATLEVDIQCLAGRKRAIEAISWGGTTRVLQGRVFFVISGKRVCKLWMLLFNCWIKPGISELAFDARKNSSEDTRETPKSSFRLAGIPSKAINRILVHRDVEWQ
ncbi:hypothetical protein AVEN_258774-1 [Araneus ventricosus]|uniref:Uncharacterized protein n=1 Tax=Araneus ventricosus TaxID=182803 RepID=A0A4Y2D3N2_ARAVE|nr:hypothetical protein AVEN_258774-1 [Araneus ventricosus]